MAMLDTTDIDFKGPGLMPAIEPNGWRKATSADVGSAFGGIIVDIGLGLYLTLSVHSSGKRLFAGVLCTIVVIAQIRFFVIIRRKYGNGEEIQTGFWRRVSAKRSME